MDQPDRSKLEPPPRPPWVKVSLIVAIGIVAVVLILALVGSEHGPGRHLQGGDAGGHTPLVEPAH